MNQDLYEALQEAAKRQHGVESVLSFKSDQPEDRKAFDRLVLKLYELQKLGFVEFKDDNRNVLKDTSGRFGFISIACRFTYAGQKALEFGSYEAYQASLPTPRPLAVNVDQSFKNYGSMNGSNIAVHSNQVNQTVSENSQVDRLFQQIIETLRQDATLTQAKLQELLDDVESLRKELKKPNPRPGILTELYSYLGNTASIASYIPQLQALIG